jgi:hypothetical protein
LPVAMPPRPMIMVTAELTPLISNIFNAKRTAIAMLIIRAILLIDLERIQS